MPNKGNNKKPAPEDLQTQLTELNNRARAYASQLWQVPFAYLAFVAILLTQSKNRQFGWGLLLISIAGVAVLVHMFYVVYYHNGTAEKIRMLEKVMGLPSATRARPGGTVAPFMALVFLGVLAPFMGSLGSSSACVVIWVYTAPVLFGIIAYYACNHLTGGTCASDSDGHPKEEGAGGEDA